MTLSLITQWVAGILVVIGGVFMVIGAIGVNRMPDVFTRMHAASVGDTLGFGLIMVGLMVLGGFTLVTVKLIFLVLFVMLTGPVATHALARAALQAGIKPALTSEGKQGKAKAKARGAASSKR